VLAYAVHPVLSGPAIQRIEDSVIEKVVVTNTIPLSAAARESKKISQLSVGKIFGEAIRRIHEADSLSSLFV
jgi:ribose-phosphate pyrophosphokinase